MDALLLIKLRSASGITTLLNSIITYRLILQICIYILNTAYFKDPNTNTIDN